MTATVAKDTWEMGENGEVRAVFTVGARTGPQHKTIAVTTDDAPDQPTILRLTIELPEAVALQPQALVWASGSAAEERTADLVVAHPTDTDDVTVQCLDDAFAVTVERRPEPGRWRLRVRPRDPTRPTQAAIRVTTMIAGRPNVQVLYTAVR